MNLMQRFKTTTLIIYVLLLIGVYAQPGTATAQELIRQYQLVNSGNGYDIRQASVKVPEISAAQVLVRIHAVSLNRRDIALLQGNYPVGDANGLVPLSDGAGEVIGVGSEVTGLKPGDRVAGTFFTRWNDGKFSPAALASARGGAVDGVLSEMIVADEDSLVLIPPHLSYEEAATLPCAGVTAWNGLFKSGNLQPGEYVLLEGTGGVSIFGLQFAAAAGAKPIITSSSDDKLVKARSLGAFDTINYRTTPDWETRVMEITGQTGVQQVLEVGGVDTLPRAAASLAFGGHIALIGGLSGFGGNIPVMGLLARGASATGIYVGSREDFVNMNAFITEHRIRPVIDRVFEFDDAGAAIQYMIDSGFLGKIVIRI